MDDKTKSIGVEMSDEAKNALADIYTFLLGQRRLRKKREAEDARRVGDNTKLKDDEPEK